MLKDPYNAFMHPMTHRDPIHGDVRYDAVSVALLDTPSLQRLGRVYQLGYSHLVYRGGNHTRLSHAMGSVGVAHKMVALLRSNYDAARDAWPLGALSPEEFLPSCGKDIEARWRSLYHLVGWGSLLHDCGHVPMGHTLEDEFENIYDRHDKITSPRMPHIWLEQAPGKQSDIREVFFRQDLLPVFSGLGLSPKDAFQAVMLICIHKPGESIVSDKERERIRQSLPLNERLLSEYEEALSDLQSRKIFVPFMSDLVANTICADYLDYLRRDPYNVGLDVLRDDRVASRFYVARDDAGVPRMALALVDKRGKPRLDTCTGVVELVRQRFRFAEIIYYHKTKVSASAMLAKAFGLLGKPAEISSHRQFVALADVERLAEQIGKGRKVRSEDYTPQALLEPDIGDDSLLLWLQTQAWDAISAAGKDEAKLKKYFLALSMIHGILLRRLYKVSLTITREVFVDLYDGSSVLVEKRIGQVMKVFRDSQENRNSLEKAITDAAGWKEGGCLLYVPPRKNQAKGIATLALSEGDTLTLSEHHAVSADAQHLNEAYRDLWRIILLVHPDYISDFLGLSRAADACISGLLKVVDKGADRRLTGKSSAIANAAWFPYVPPFIRPIAGPYAELGGQNVDHVESIVDHFRDSQTMPNSDDLASYARLRELLQDDPRLWNLAIGLYPEPDSLNQALHEAEGAYLASREGKRVDARKEALQKLADRLRHGGLPI